MNGRGSGAARIVRVRRPHSPQFRERELHDALGQSRSAQEPAIRFDPFRSFGWRIRKRKLENRDHLSVPTAATDCHDLVLNLVDPLDCGRSAEDVNLKRNLEALREHGEETDALLDVAIGVDDRVRDQCVELPCARRAALACHFSIHANFEHLGRSPSETYQSSGAEFPGAIPGGRGFDALLLSAIVRGECHSCIFGRSFGKM